MISAVVSTDRINCFSFQAAFSGDYVVEATDGAGNVATRVFPIQAEDAPILLNSSAITFKGLDDLLSEEKTSTSQTPEERIAEIDQLLDDLYH